MYKVFYKNIANTIEIERIIYKSQLKLLEYCNLNVNCNENYYQMIEKLICLFYNKFNQMRKCNNNLLK